LPQESILVKELLSLIVSGFCEENCLRIYTSRSPEELLSLSVSCFCEANCSDADNDMLCQIMYS